MLRATSNQLLPTTVTGSWPRPSWFTGNLHERPFSSGMADVAYREQYVDAVSTVLSDQELAGLDILTNGDYHLDNDLAGRSWFSYPSERFEGVSEFDTETTFGWSYPVGSWLNEIVGGWKYHAVTDKIALRTPLEFAKIWRVAQARSEKPVKFGTIAADLAATVLTVKTDAYAQDKQDLMWDIATILNGELRELAAAGCKVIQIEEPAIHSSAAYGAPAEVLDFLVELFNHTVEGLDDVELWIHTCWGNPGAQHCFDPSISYEPSVDIYLNRLKGDVWTIESKDNDHSLLLGVRPVQGQPAEEGRGRHDQPPPPPGRDARRGGRRRPQGARVHRRGEARALVGLRLRPPGRPASDRALQGGGARTGGEHRPRRARRRADARARRRSRAPDRRPAPGGRVGRRLSARCGRPRGRSHRSGAQPASRPRASVGVRLDDARLVREHDCVDALGRKRA